MHLIPQDDGHPANAGCTRFNQVLCTSLRRGCTRQTDKVSPCWSGKTTLSSTGVAAWGAPYMGCHQNKLNRWAQGTPNGDVPVPKQTIWCPAIAGIITNTKTRTGLWAPGLGPSNAGIPTKATDASPNPGGPHTDRPLPGGRRTRPSYAGTKCSLPDAYGQRPDHWPGPLEQDRV